MSDLRPLRRELRRQRRALSASAQRQAAASVARHLAGWLRFLHSRRIGHYLASDGEIDPTSALLRGQARGAQGFLPILHPFAHNRLLFAPHRPGERLILNRYAIAEPDLRRQALTPAWSLDLVLLPLVAFDRSGARLGMGGGYYDRTFALDRPWPSRPLLVGVAHHFQERPQLPMATWDVPLDAVVTDRELILIRCR
ncbi:MAG TPA: 5-formyltetrahydrofolate cyclo-ligase [Pseudomonadales bacterium]|jgi:5-formyltetrahydrofolate cyclo-ligase|nr:5-formyltetrahydrofolate cyclo-ligase [Pseudomonadales bacterium]HMW15189.1 5-formyltetrahydrofolate cyclo-ligase [Pseudomonadales bacterium]HMW83346.1 5-formyltetrahydrofolate cyclo-ligase [Pseudomonadales bacterium]HMY97089.1 5-formyltetrahydrofolate cyclo-ligase [Pseudomonadales bacterium]HMZ70961.1 5-formyltetrahydrofolate cyclo-ligase [Pseudomonadales bacterium]